MIGQTVAHYRITARLGEGGMGVVYEAEDLRLPRRVALKFLPAGRLEDRAARERFEREARAASVLSHPDICVLHDLAEHEGQPFLVMERLHGSSLRERLQAGPVPTDEILRIGAQVADALDAAHAAGAGPPRERAVGSLLARGGALRDGHGSEALPGRLHGRGLRRDPAQGPHLPGAPQSENAG
jgi:serine/threonine protein kinase